MRNLILLLLFNSALAGAATDSISSTIEQAQALALKKNRKEACALLNRAYQATPSQVRGRSKILETLNQISKVFFTDKGQKLFESGQVMLYENADMALTQLREAQGLEDENILILSHVARAQIIRGECDGALLNIEMARSLNPFATEPAVLELRALLCAKRYDQFRDKAKSITSSDKWDQGFIQYLQAQEHLRLNASHKAYEMLLKVTDEFAQFPEGFYQLAKAGKALDKDVLPWLQKYSVLCKGVTFRERKKFGYEPQLCTRMKEVDEELAASKREI